MTTEQRAQTYRERMRHDIANTLRQHLGPSVHITGTLLDALVDDGMFPCEHLLVEIEALEDGIAGAEP